MSSAGLSEPNTITCDATTLFLSIVQKLAEFDRAGFLAVADNDNDPFAARSAFEMRSYMRRNFSMLTILDRFRDCEVEFPASLRTKLGPRLNFNEARTYGDAAQITLEVMILAGLPHVPGAYI